MSQHSRSGQRRQTAQMPSLPPAPKPTPPRPTTNPPPPPPPKSDAERAHPAESLEVLSPMPSTVAARDSRRFWDLKKRHLIRVYSLFSLLSALAVAQLVTLRLLKLDFNVLISPTIPGSVWLLLALGSLLTLAFVHLASLCPCNYILAIVIMEMIVFFVNSHQWPRVPTAWIGGVLAIVLLLNLLLFVVGMCLPLKVLPGIIFMIVATLCCVVIVVSIYVIVYLNGNRYMLRYVSMVSLFYVGSLVLFTITVVHQRRFNYVAKTDHVLQASTLAMLFVYMIHVVSTFVRFGQFLVDQV
ncbi:uncharacterized protein LOC108052156 [Drosophila rhopaloa]|uniref:Protein lifeguard 1 n=1 Tax=Drosophila rhopaloa TaxID=1041015 RepID=A0ABM5I4J9_DRORH|nr:uncharacterized protein LOC108052156 [Drosophila rhopaloa]